MLFFLRLKWGILKNICIFAPIFTPYFPEKDSEGVGDILRISVLQRFVFGFFERRKFKITNQRHCRVDASGGI